jgi:hypothetical protein
VLLRAGESRRAVLALASVAVAVLAAGRLRALGDRGEMMRERSRVAMRGRCRGRGRRDARAKTRGGGRGAAEIKRCIFFPRRRERTRAPLGRRRSPRPRCRCRCRTERPSCLRPRATSNARARGAFRARRRMPSVPRAALRHLRAGVFCVHFSRGSTKFAKEIARAEGTRIAPSSVA